MPPPTPLPKWRLASFRDVCSRIAQTGLQQRVLPGTAALGEITLHSHQLDAVARIHHSIAAHGGALLADSVGLGKTFVALAVARAYDAVTIVAPATLLPMWRQSIAQAECTNIELHSLHTLSRRTIAANRASTKSLVIFDEAHHLRTRNTIRYRNAAALASGCDVLLLSATPVHNRARELLNLLALFLGHRADALDDDTIAAYVVRRTAANATTSGAANVTLSATANGTLSATANGTVSATANGTANDTLSATANGAANDTMSGGTSGASSDATRSRPQAQRDALPAVREHEPLSVSSNLPVLDCLLSLPAPLPAKGGAAAGALIRLGLLHAWCSSDAALTDTIRRRQVRGEAMLHALAHGRYPTQRELRSFVAGTDSIQLGFAELLIANVATNCAALLRTIAAHLDGLQALLQLHTKTAIADGERVALLRSLIGPAHAELVRGRRPTAPPIVAFSHFACTVRALHRALSDIAGVASLTSREGRIATGVVPRQELIQQFAPRAHGRPPPPVHAHIHLLLTTDLLSEGVNLQDAGTVVHLDLPWTDAARQQRVGRLARMGSGHEIVNVFTFAPPPGIERTLRIVRTLQRKARLSEVLIGGNSATNRTGSAIAASPRACTSNAAQFSDQPEWNDVGHIESGPEIATRLHNVLRAWHEHPTPHDDELIVAAVPGARAGWIAAVEGVTPVVLSSLSQTPREANHYRNQSCNETHTLRITTSGVATAVSPPCMLVTDAMDSHAASSATAQLMRVIDSIITLGPASSPADASTYAQLRSVIVTVQKRIDQWHGDRAISGLAGPGARALPASHRLALKIISERVAEVPAALRHSVAQMANAAMQFVLQARGAGMETHIQNWCDTSPRIPLRQWLSTIVAEHAPHGPLMDAPAPQPESFRIRALLLLCPCAASMPCTANSR